MNAVGHAAASNRPVSSDDEDLLLFQSFGLDLAGAIIIVKHNDPIVRRLYLNATLSERVAAWRRFGHILGQSTNLKELKICNVNPDIVALCDGLKSNQSIDTIGFRGINLHDEEQMRSLAQFFIINPSLKEITLTRCNIGPSSINIFSNALLNRSEDTLEKLDLSNNNFGDMNLDQLVVALIKCKFLQRLWLNGNRIGLRGCTSIAKLLENQESNLQYLYLGQNIINDEAVLILVDSLAKNTKLKWLDMRRNYGITYEGWSAMLKVLCNNPSIDNLIKSNHTLYSVGYYPEDTMVRALGVDNANLLYASLDLNRTGNSKFIMMRIKIIWSHAQGNLNVGFSSIANGAMPGILAWFGNDSNATNANLIQHHKTPLPKAKIDTIRLDSIYRILRCRPGLCHKKTHDDENGKQCSKGMPEESEDIRYRKCRAVGSLIRCLIILVLRIIMVRVGHYAGWDEQMG